MSSVPSEPIEDDPGNGEALTAKQRRIVGYLHEHAETRTYFKSRRIGRELGLSTKEVGRNIAQIREGNTEIEIEPWGYSSATTWEVTRPADR